MYRAAQEGHNQRGNSACSARSACNAQAARVSALQAASCAPSPGEGLPLPPPERERTKLPEAHTRRCMRCCPCDRVTLAPLDTWATQIPA
eukprot:2860802-Alexandrium_andersonii.AAC.1